MAIARDTYVVISATTGTSLTYSHTCTGSNLILLVEVVSGQVSDKVTGVTYNGVAMTQLGISQRPTAGDRFRTLWYLVAPATGAHNVVITGSSSDYIQSSSVSYTGVDQVTGVEANATTNTGIAVTTLAQAVTPIAPNAWVIGAASADVSPGYTAGANTTRIDANANFIELTANPVVTPASTTLNISNSASNMIMQVFSLKPFVASLPAPVRRNNQAVNRAGTY